MESMIENPVLIRPERWQVIVSGMPGTAASVSPERLRAYRRDRRAHSQAELMVALRGRTVYGLGEAFYPVNPGTVMAFAPMEVHQDGYPDDGPDVEHLWVSLMHEGFTVRRVRVRGGRMVSETVGDEVYDALRLPPGTRWPAAGTPEARAEPLPLRRFRARVLTESVILAAMDSERRGGRTGARGGDEARARLIASIRRHLRRTAGRGDSLASLARIAGYSRCHFLRLFHRETGETVQAYIDRCRLLRMKEGQARGESQKVIAAELGFASPQSFSRWRRRHAHGSPEKLQGCRGGASAGILSEFHPGKENGR